MEKIVAVLKKKYKGTSVGFVFDTDVQMYVEMFMLKMHFGSRDYVLYFDNDKPHGIYTHVTVVPLFYETGNLSDVEFKV